MAQQLHWQLPDGEPVPLDGCQQDGIAIPHDDQDDRDSTKAWR